MPQRRCPRGRCLQGDVPTGRLDQFAATFAHAHNADLGRAMAHHDALHPRGSCLFNHITDAGCATFAAALRGGALPALKKFHLYGNPASREAQDAAYSSRSGLIAGPP